jgi:hypothetical protein
MSTLPRAALVYAARAMEYGDFRYRRGNYYGPPPDGVRPEERLLVYLDAILRHATAVTESLNRAIGTGGNLTAAACVQDPDSGLPHLAHLLASAMLAITVAEDDDLVPADPGTPWTEASPSPPAPPASVRDDSTDTTLYTSAPRVPAVCTYVHTDLGPLCGRHDVSLESFGAGLYRCRLSHHIVGPT